MKGELKLQWQKQVEMALDKLGREFDQLDLTFHKMIGAKEGDVTSYWPGAQDDDILVCVFKGKYIYEPFHRQDFFFINYAYQLDYQALSIHQDNLITIHEDECYISQPYTGYALRYNSAETGIIIGVLIRRDTFFRDYLPTLYTDSDLFRFFVEPQKNRFSDEFIHLHLARNHMLRTILELMVVEYADRQEGTQQVLKTMLQTLFMQIARQYRQENARITPASPVERIMQYMADHSDVVTLKHIASRFSYNPNYVSALLRRKTGKTFSQILLEKRMIRAELMLQNTTLSVEEIAAMLGYSDKSNFYKAFREYYGMSPREYMKREQPA